MLCMLTVFVNHVFVCLVPIPQFLAVLDFMVIALHSPNSLQQDFRYVNLMKSCMLDCVHCTEACVKGKLLNNC